MIFFIAFVGILFFLNLFLGFHVLFTKPKSKIHIVFFILSFILALYDLQTIYFQSVKELSRVYAHLIYGTAFSLNFPYFAIVISTLLSNSIKHKKLLFSVLYIPVIIVFILVLKNAYCLEIIRFKDSWRVLEITCNHFYFIYFLPFGLYILFLVTINVIWFKRTKLIKEKKQALILIFSFLTPMILNTFYYIGIIHNMQIVKYDIIGTTVIFYSIWTTGIYIAINKYQLLSITPQLASNEIFGAVDEAIILLDPDFKVINTNKRINEITGNEKIYDHSDKLEFYFSEYETLTNELKNMSTGKIKNISCRLNLISFNSKEPILMDVKCSIVFDHFKDIAGYLIIANEVKGTNYLIHEFKITNQEARVIQSVINGNTNINIANELNITERTVKTHLTRIFNKLGVDNKVQLIMLLKDYNLIPEKQSDKTLFFK